jgi:hypothetical protein
VRKKRKTVAKYAEKRKALLEAGDFVGLQKLPKNASPVRLHNRCKLQVDLEVTCVNLVFHVLHSVN